MFEQTYIIIGFILLLIGFIGCIIPALPGPPLSFAGLLLLFLAGIPLSLFYVVILGLGSVSITVLDYLFPAIVTEKFGGTKSGFWGALIGLFLGIIFPLPGGFLLGTFLGALIGEMTTGKKVGNCVKPAFGSLIGVLLGIIGKLVLCTAITIYYLYSVIVY